MSESKQRQFMSYIEHVETLLRMWDKCYGYSQRADTLALQSIVDAKDILEYLAQELPLNKKVLAFNLCLRINKLEESIKWRPKDTLAEFDELMIQNKAEETFG